MKKRIRRGGNYPSNNKQINLKEEEEAQEHTDKLYTKSLHDPENQDSVITHSLRARYPEV